MSYIVNICIAILSSFINYSFQKITIYNNKAFLFYNNNNFIVNLTLRKEENDFFPYPFFIFLENFNFFLKLNCLNGRKFNFALCKGEFNATSSQHSFLSSVNIKLFDQNKGFTDFMNLPVYSFPKLNQIFPNTLTINQNGIIDYKNKFIISLNFSQNSNIKEYKFECMITKEASILYMGHVFFDSKESKIFCNFNDIEKNSNHTIFELFNIFLEIKISFRNSYAYTERRRIFPVFEEKIIYHYPKLIFEDDNEDQLNFIFSRPNENVLFFQRTSISKVVVIALRDYTNNNLVYLPPHFINEDDTIYKPKGIKQAIKSDFIRKTKIQVMVYFFYLKITEIDNFTYQLPYIYLSYYQPSYEGIIYYFRHPLKMQSPSPQYFLVNSKKKNITLYSNPVDQQYSYFDIQRFMDIFLNENISIFCSEEDTENKKVIDCTKKIFFDDKSKNIFLNLENIREENPKQTFLTIFIEGKKISTITIIYIEQPSFSYLLPRNYLINNKNEITVNLFGSNMHFDPLSNYNNKTLCYASTFDFIKMTAERIIFHSDFHISCIFNILNVQKITKASARVGVIYNDQIKYVNDDPKEGVINLFYIDISKVTPKILSPYSPNRIEIKFTNDYQELTFDFFYQENILTSYFDLAKNVYIIENFEFITRDKTISIKIKVKTDYQYEKEIFFDVAQIDNNIYIDKYKQYSLSSILLYGNIELLNPQKQSDYKLYCSFNLNKNGELVFLDNGVYVCSFRQNITMAEKDNFFFNISSLYYEIPFKLSKNQFIQLKRSDIYNYEKKNYKAKNNKEIKCTEYYFKVDDNNYFLIFYNNSQILQNVLKFDYKICYDSTLNCTYYLNNKLPIQKDFEGSKFGSVSLVKAKNFKEMVYIFSYSNKELVCSHKLYKGNKAIYSNFLQNFSTLYKSIKEKLVEQVIHNHIKHSFLNQTHIFYYQYDYLTSMIEVIVDYNDHFYSFIKNENGVLICNYNFQEEIPIKNDRIYQLIIGQNKYNFIKCPIDIDKVKDKITLFLSLKIKKKIYQISNEIIFSLPLNNKEYFKLNNKIYYCSNETNTFTFKIIKQNNIKPYLVYCLFSYKNEKEKKEFKVVANTLPKGDFQCSVSNKSFCERQMQLFLSLKYQNQNNGPEIDLYEISGEKKILLKIIKSPFILNDYWPKQFFYSNQTNVGYKKTFFDLYVDGNYDNYGHEINITYNNDNYQCQYEESIKLCKFSFPLPNIQIDEKKCVSSLSIIIMSEDANKSIHIYPIPLNDIYANTTTNSFLLQTAYKLYEEDLYCGVKDKFFSKFVQVNQINSIYQCNFTNLYQHKSITLYSFIEKINKMIPIGEILFNLEDLNASSIKKEENIYKENLKKKITISEFFYKYKSNLIIKGGNFFSKKIKYQINSFKGQCERQSEKEIICKNIPKEESSDFSYKMVIIFKEQHENKVVFIIRRKKVSENFQIISEILFSYTQPKEEKSIIFYLHDNKTATLLSSIRIKINNNIFPCVFEEKNNLLFCDISSYFLINSNSPISVYPIYIILSDRIPEVKYQQTNVTFITKDISNMNILSIINRGNYNHFVFLKDHPTLNLTQNEHYNPSLFMLSSKEIPNDKYKIILTAKEQILIYISEEIILKSSFFFQYNNINLKRIDIMSSKDYPIECKACDIENIYTYMKNVSYSIFVKKGIYDKKNYELRKWENEETFSMKYPLITYQLSLYSFPKIMLTNKFSSMISYNYFNVQFLSLYKGEENIIFKDIVCSIIHIKYRFFYSVVADNNTCYNLLCHNKDNIKDERFILEVQWKKHLLLSHPFICKPHKYEMVDVESNLIPSHHFSFYTNDTLQINAFSYHSNKTSHQLKVDFDYDTEIKNLLYNEIKNETVDFIEEKNKVSYKCDNTFYLFDISSFNIYEKRYIINIENSPFPNYFYTKKPPSISAKVKGNPLSKNEQISIKLVNKNDLSQFFVEKVNITSIDRDNSLFTISFFLSSNELFKGNGFNILVSQYNAKFDSISINDPQISFVSNPYITSSEPKLIRFDGSKVTIYLTKINDYNLSDLICGWDYGIGTILYSPITDDNPKYYCDSPNLELTTKKQNMLILRIESKRNKLVGSNEIKFNLFESDEHKIINIFPLWYQKNTILQLEIHFISNENYIYESSFGNIKCKVDNEVISGAFDAYNRTILCNLDEINDYTKVSQTSKVFYSYNSGVNWQDSNIDIHFYEKPTINLVTYEYNGKFILTITGDNFIDADNNLRCIYINKIGTIANIPGTFVSENKIKCDFIPDYDIKENNPYDVFISYNMGKELIDTKYTLKYNYPPIVTELSPLWEISNYQTNVDVSPYESITKSINTKSKCRAFSLNEFVLVINYRCLLVYESLDPISHFQYSPIEISYNDIDYSNSKITFYKFNIKFDSLTPLLGPITGGTKIVIKGENFMINPQFLFLIDSNKISPNYINSTYINIVTPAVDVSKKIDFSYTVNDINYHNLGINFIYYEEIEIVSIAPSHAYTENTTVVFIEAKNMINNDLLVCKADEYVIKCEFVVNPDTNKEYCKCILPPFEYIKHGIINPSESDMNVKITLSNNNQNFSPTSKNFKFYYHDEEIEKSLKYYPKHGPEEGGTLITIKSDSFKSDLTTPKCFFGNKEVEGTIDLALFTINCISPPLSDIDKRKIDFSGLDLFFAYVELNLVYEERNIILSYVYNVNITITDYYPNNVEIGKSIDIVIQGGSFYYYSNLKCKFVSKDGTIEEYTNGISLNFGNFKCPTPIIATTTFTELTMTFTMNKYDYYGQDQNMIIYYRYEEKIISVNPNILPVSPTPGHLNLINLKMKYYFNSSYKRSFCLLSNTDDLDTSTFQISFNTQPGNAINEVECNLPNLKRTKLSNLINNGGFLYISVSSNGINYVTPFKKITFYVNPVINSLTKTLFPTSHPFSFSIIGNNFHNNVNGYLIIKCNNDKEEYTFNADFVSGNELKVTDASIPKCSQEYDYGNINLSLSYDFVNYFTFVGKTFCYTDHVVLSVFPLVAIKKITKKITFVIEDNIYLFKQYKCVFRNLNGIDIGIGNVEIVSNHVITCGDVNTINFDAGNHKVKLALLGNGEDLIINDEIDIYVVDKESLNIGKNTIINTYSMNKDVINIKGSGFDMNVKFYLKIDTLVIGEKTHDDANNLQFEREKLLYSKEYPIYISSNLNDWTDTNLILSLSNLFQCEQGHKCIDNLGKGLYFHSDSQECKKGSYCSSGIERNCKIGTYSDTLYSFSCDECPLGTVCFTIGITIPSDCPPGYQCNVKGIFSHYQLKPCPEGYYCDDSTLDYSAINGIINTPGHVYSCPTGFYCGIGTYSPNYKYNVMGYPQYCLEGVICAQNLQENQDNNISTGSDNQYGLRTCPKGKYCIFGSGHQCPKGSECIEENLSAPSICIPGTYLLDSSLSNAKCELCPIGSYCDSDGTIEPIYCKAGRVCEYSGQHRPSGYCPVGFYCTDSTIGFPNDKDSHSDITKKYYPKNCKDGQLCLSGIVTNITDESNPEAPQPCRPGMVCKGGTDSGSSLCPPGFYCPGSTDPIPAPPGSYVPGEGFVSPLECAPGYYSDSSGQVECTKCNPGTYNYLQGQTKCLKCEKGSYRSNDMSSINCALCPSGTYNENEGSSSVSDCISCPKGYLCDIEGMSDFASQSRICPQGYICKEGTNSDSIELCPEGFFCSEGTSEKYQFHLCFEGYYCDKGSTTTNNKKNPCLVGWYCPYGSYYDSTANIILTSPLISEVIEQKRLYSSADEDLKNINKVCEENENIPIEYLSSYTSLKCPKGTTSPLGSICIGQCLKDESQPSEIIDPLNPEDYENQGLSLRYLETTSDIDKYILMKSFELIYLTFTFSSIPDFLEFKKDYSISISTSKSVQTLPLYITSNNFKMPSSKTIRFKIFNYNQIDQQVLIRIHLHNGLYSILSNLFLNTAGITRFLPYRANKGTKNLFTFFLKKETFLSSSISLPYNFYENTIQESNHPLSIGYYPTESNFTYDHGYSEKDPYLVQLFEENSLEGIFMPWVPFLSNCAGYDDKILLFDLLENSESCFFPAEDSIVIVKSFPSQGLTAISDICKINLTCRYDEINQSVISNKWFSLTSETILAYVSSNAKTIGNITNSRANTIIENINRYEKNMIPVSFVPFRKGVTSLNCFPQDIVIDIQYYQYDINNKRIVDFIIQMYNYTQCLNMSSESTQNVNPYYNVLINYYPLDYFDLLNYFQFSYLSYFLLIFFLGFTIVFLTLVIWGLSNVFTKLKEVQSLKLFTFIKNFYYPAFKGFLIADILVISLSSYMYGIEVSNTFLKYPSTWEILDAGGFESMDLEKNANEARTSIYFVIIGFYLFQRALIKLVPFPPKKEQVSIEKKKIIESNQNSTIKKEAIKDFDEVSQDNSDEEEDDAIDAEVEISIVIGWKQKMMLLKILLCSMYLVFKMEYIISDVYRKHVVIYIIIMNIIDYFFDELALKVFFSEALIAVPILCANRLLKFLTLVSANDFKESLICYIILLLFNGIIRIFITPIQDEVEFLLNYKIEVFLAKKSTNKTFWKILYEYFYNNEKINEGLDEEIIKIRFIEKKNKSTIEPILRTMLSFSISVTSLVMAPHCLLLMFIFENETQAFMSFNLKSGNLIYYIIFALAIFIPELIIEMILTNYTEIIHGYRIQEYINYCRYRYSIRNSSWISMKDTMDTSINSFWRSLDSLLFSEQYYYLLFYASMSLVFLILSFKVALSHEYNPFGEPMLVIFILLFMASFIAINLVYKFIEYFGGIFSFEKFRLNPREGKFLDFIKVDSKIKDITKFMTTELFRQKFIKVNKNWIIENLEFVLGFDKLDKEINDPNEKVDAKLQYLYQEAVNYEAIDKEIQNKKELIKRDLQLMPYNQELQGEVNNEFGIRLDISKDSVIDDPITNLGKINMVSVKKPYTILIAKIWKNKAREVIRFKMWSIDVLEEARMTYCEKCNSTFNLHVFQKIPIVRVVKEFKKENSGNKLIMANWQKYYAKNQTFTTLCMECAYLRNSKYYAEKLGNQKVIQIKNDRAKTHDTLKKNHIKQMLLMWLLESRTKILIDRMKKRKEKK